MYKQEVFERVRCILDAAFEIADMNKRNEYPERFKVPVDETYDLFRTEKCWVLIDKNNGARREIKFDSRCDLGRLIQAYLSLYEI